MKWGQKRCPKWETQCTGSCCCELDPAGNCVSQNSLPCVYTKLEMAKLLEGKSLWLDMMRTNVDATGRFQFVLTFLLCPIRLSLFPHLTNSSPRPINYRQAMGFEPTEAVATKGTRLSQTSPQSPSSLHSHFNGCTHMACLSFPSKLWLYTPVPVLQEDLLSLPFLISISPVTPTTV